METHDTAGESRNGTPERRDFFRIEDRIGLEFRKLAPDAAIDEQMFDTDHLAMLKTELRRHDQDFRNQLAILAERDRTLTAALKSLNGKLDTLARIMAFEQNPLQPEDWQEVTLSEGGLSFTSASGALKKGDRLAVRMTLPPDLVQAEAVAEILEIHPESADSTRVHTEFVQLTDGDRQQIARHVMRWQIRQRQKG